MLNELRYAYYIAWSLFEAEILDSFQTATIYEGRHYENMTSRSTWPNPTNHSRPTFIE